MDVNYLFKTKDFQAVLSISGTTIGGSKGTHDQPGDPPEINDMDAVVMSVRFRCNGGTLQPEFVPMEGTAEWITELFFDEFHRSDAVYDRVMELFIGV